MVTRQRKSPGSNGQTKCEEWRGSTRPQGGEFWYRIKFMTEVKMSQLSQFHWQTENWEKLTPLEAKMKELEQLAQSIADGLVFFMKREKEMESTNGKSAKLFKWICAPQKKSKFTHHSLAPIPVLRQTPYLPC